MIESRRAPQGHPKGRLEGLEYVTCSRSESDHLMSAVQLTLIDKSVVYGITAAKAKGSTESIKCDVGTVESPTSTTPHYLLLL